MALFSECVYYLALLQLYEAKTAAQVKLIERTLLEALSEMRDRTGAQGVACTSATRAHSLILYHRIADKDVEVADALFEQLTLLHRCASLLPFGRHQPLSWPFQSKIVCVCAGWMWLNTWRHGSRVLYSSFNKPDVPGYSWTRSFWVTACCCLTKVRTAKYHWMVVHFQG